jgi:hypothetical protein
MPATPAPVAPEPPQPKKPAEWWEVRSTDLTTDHGQRMGRLFRRDDGFGDYREFASREEAEEEINEEREFFAGKPEADVRMVLRHVFENFEDIPEGGKATMLHACGDDHGLAVWYDAQAIREHFEEERDDDGDSLVPPDLTDGDLNEAAKDYLFSGKSNSDFDDDIRFIVAEAKREVVARSGVHL